ncbi:glycosyltransferase family 39 protein [Chloroflexota bacterium]
MSSTIGIKLKQWLYQPLEWRQHLGLCLLVLITLTLHFSIVMQPDELVFDEHHYVTDARSIIAGEGTLNPEHPPLGKLSIVSGILLFGDNPLGWRFFSVLFGTIGIVLFYFICCRLGMPGEASLLATFLFALENLNFVHASVAMLDVSSVTLMLCAFLLYLHGGYLKSGICVGLSALAKLTGVLAFPAIFFHWLLTGRRQRQRFLLSVLVALVSFFLLMLLLDFVVSGQLLSPIYRIRDMLTAGGSLTFASAFQETASRPWEWLLSPEIMFCWYDPQYVVAISFTIWALIIPAVLYMLFRAIRGNGASLFGLSWFAGTYLSWIFISLITDRVSFLYYFYPTVGAICIGLGLGLSQLLKLWQGKRRSKLGWTALLFVSGYLALHVAVFGILSPVSVPLVKWFPIP